MSIKTMKMSEFEKVAPNIRETLARMYALDPDHFAAALASFLLDVLESEESQSFQVTRRLCETASEMLDNGCAGFV